MSQGCWHRSVFEGLRSDGHAGSPLVLRTHYANALSLVEMLVVVAIIAILAAVLLPGVARARTAGRTTACRANLRSLMLSVATYTADHDDSVVPSYNMHGVTGGPTNPLDGWGPLLERHEFLSADARTGHSPFLCPDTLDVSGITSTQTGLSQDNPRGYMDWPAVVTMSMNYPTTIPGNGITRITRVAYWINGDNPIGVPRVFDQGIHFTGSVGYGPDPNGRTMRPNMFSQFQSPTRLVALADGLYAGKQEMTRWGDPNSRIGYRHPGRSRTANAGFADGHVAPIEGDQFPRRLEPGQPVDSTHGDLLGAGPTLFARPLELVESSN